MQSTTQARLKEALRARNMLPIELARRSRIGKSAISQYLSGKVTPKQDKIYKLAQALKVNEPWLMGYNEPMDAQSFHADIQKLPNMEPYEPVMVPIVGTIAAGTPILAEENIEGYAPLQGKKADFALTVKGDSMIGDNIHPGDIVFIRQQPTVEIGEIAAVLIDGDATLKHFYYDGDSVTLVSSNPTYKPMVFHKGDCDEFRVLGKAIAYLHDLE